MNILSYRGPLAGGGVATALSSLTSNFAQDIEHWWHVYDGRIEDSIKSDSIKTDSIKTNSPNTASRDSKETHRQRIEANLKENISGEARAIETQLIESSTLSTAPINTTESEPAQLIIKKAILDGHYRYCNNFLWPIMHDMPEMAKYNEIDQSFYRRFNFSFATHIIQRDSNYSLSPCFIQDYQLALIPRIFKAYSKTKHRVFWHIPWPKVVAQEHVPMIRELASSLLHSELLGFHTQEYAENFLRFARGHLPEYHANFKKMQITPKHHHRNDRHLRQVNGLEDQEDYDCATNLLVAPLGLDLNFWNTDITESSCEFALTHPELRQHQQLEALKARPFILSVDRADYTKGIYPRLEAIRHFFQVAPEQIGQISFVLVCQRTRPGLEHFDNYWHKCRQLADAINRDLESQDWAPIIWIADNIPQEALMELYQKARAMMVTPLRDGLNLTAKEYVASLTDNPGTLLLSAGAGAWVELGELCLEANPHNPQEMAATILHGLSLPLSERQKQATLMKMTLRKQTLQSWWESFQGNAGSRSPAENWLAQENSKILEAIGF